MEDNGLVKEAGYLSRLQFGLEEYAKNYCGSIPAVNSPEKNCTLEVIHRENGIIVIYTE